MNIRFLSAIVLGVALGSASAQDAPIPPRTGQASPPGGSGRQGLGWRAGAMGRMADTGMGGRGVTGTVTAVAADHYVVKTDAGQSYTVHFSANTRIMKQAIRRRGEGSGDSNPPLTLRPTDIKVGDAVAALGEIDPNANSVGAVVILQIDPERARQMREMQASYGKTWLMGKVTAIDETKVTLMGSVDNAAHSFVADENTTFRKRRDPITLADVQVGDAVRVEGAVKDGNFVAASVVVMGMPPGGTPNLPHENAPAPQTK